jgi:FAD/FMN-containing dehydrogenase
MERRRFLAWGATGTASALLSACGGGGSPDGATAAPPPAPAPPPSTGPAQAEWDGLARQLKGQLLRPGQPGYEQFRPVANARYDGVRPQALLRCADSADVQAGLAFARRLALPLTPRSGGHSYTGASTGPGLVIDVGPMDSVRLEGEIAHVGAGAKLADVYAALIAQGRCIPSGSCVSVGIAGITLGGGFGVLDRAHGLSCDALVAARLISADGRELLCSEDENSELFWALRGAGGGANFGIVSGLSLRTHAIAPLSQFRAGFGLEALPALLAAWQDWPAQGLPDTVWSQLVLAPEGCLLWGLGIGTPAEVEPVWQALLARIPQRPVMSSLQASSYQEVMLGACAGLSPAQCHLPSQHADGRLGRTAMAASSDFFDAPLPPAAAAQALAGALGARRAAGLPGTVVLNLMGGAIARVAPEASAFVHRRALFSAQYLCEFFPGASAAALAEAEQWAHGMRGLMAPWSSGRAYQNYPNALLSAPLQAYYGSNLARLQQIKARIDPQRVFGQAQGL